MKVAIAFLLYIFINGVLCYSELDVGTSKCTESDICIHILGSLKGITDSIDKPTLTGLLLWQKHINIDSGGICVNGHGESEGSCSGEKLQVNFKFIEMLDDIIDIQHYENSIDEYVKDVGHSEDNVPHFIVSPGSKELTEYLAKSTAFYDEIQTVQGFDIFMIGNTNNYNINDYKYQFILLPLLQYKQMALSSIDLFKNRYKARSYVILLDKEASEKTQLIIDGYISERENDEDVKYLIKRCKSQISDPDGINCVNANCNNKTDTCTFPQIDLSLYENYLERVNYLTKWMNVIKNSNPDVFISGSDRNILDIVITMKQVDFLPKVAVTIQKEYIYNHANKVNLINSNWHYFVEFDEILNTGTTGKYMGKTKDIINYINDNVDKIHLDSINYKYDNEINNDIIHILHGITFGITLQRIMELSSTEEVTNRIIYPQKVNTNLAFSVIRHTTQTLGSWNSFYGEIQFNTNGINTAHQGFTFQIQYNRTDDNKNHKRTTISVPVSPSSVPNCNLIKNCTSTNNYKDCSCDVVYPAEWEWSPSSDDNFIKFSSVFGIVFLLLDICLIICFLYVSLLVARQMNNWDFSSIPKTPPIYLISAFFYIFYSIYELGERNSYMCKSSAFFNCCASWFVYLALTFTIMEEEGRLNGRSKETKRTYIIVSIIQGYYLILFLIITMSGYGVSSEAIETLVDDISPLVYYRCLDEKFNTMVYLFNCYSFIVHVICIFYYRLTMSTHFRSMNYYFSFISSIPVIYKPFICYLMDEGKNESYVKVAISSFTALLIILPFFFLNYFLSAKKTDELYFSHSDSLRCIKNAFKHSSVRNFLKCSMERDKSDDAILLDLVGDIHRLLKTKDAKDSQELAKEMIIKYFDENIHHFIPQDFIDLFKEKVDKPLSMKKQLIKFVDKIAEDCANKHYWEIFLISEYYFGFDNLHLFLNSLRKRSIRKLNELHEYLRVAIIVENTKDVNVFREHVKHYNEDLNNRSNSSIFRSRRDRSSVRQSTAVSSNVRVSLATSTINNTVQNKSQRLPSSPNLAGKSNDKPSEFESVTTTIPKIALDGKKDRNEGIKQQHQTQLKEKQQQQQQQNGKNGNNEKIHTESDNDNTILNSLAGFKSEGRYSSQRGLSTSGSDSENMVLNGQASGDSSNSHSKSPVTNYASHKPSSPPRSGVFSYSNALSSGRDTSVKGSDGYSKTEISRNSNKEEKDVNAESTSSYSNKESYTNNETDKS